MEKLSIFVFSKVQTFIHSFLAVKPNACLFALTNSDAAHSQVQPGQCSVYGFFLESHKYATVAAVKSFTVLLLLGIVKFCLVVLLRLSKTEIRVERVLQLEILISSAMCYNINIFLICCNESLDSKLQTSHVLLRGALVPVVTTDTPFLTLMI